MAHAVGLLLLPFARDLIEGPTPLHLVEKPSPGTGASLLVDVLTSPATGHSVQAMTEGGGEEEWRKRITAKLRSGPAVTLIDNVRHKLDSASLSAALTCITWEDRLLGVSEVVRLPVRTAWVATGNNPALSNELARRTVRIRMDAKVDMPWLRTTFRHGNLRGWAAGHRGELVWAALTLVQQWITRGRPPGTRTLGMFEAWARVIGGILQSADIPGFLGNLDELYRSSNAEAATWRAFVAAWWEQHQETPVGVKTLYALATGGEFDLELGTGSEQSQRVRLGKILVQARDRQFGDCRIVEGGRLRNAVQWRLERVPEEAATALPVAEPEALLGVQPRATDAQPDALRDSPDSHHSPLPDDNQAIPVRETHTRLTATLTRDSHVRSGSLQEEEAQDGECVSLCESFRDPVLAHTSARTPVGERGAGEPGDTEEVEWTA